jgi:hypothetical protein
MSDENDKQRPQAPDPEAPHRRVGQLGHGEAELQPWPDQDGGRRDQARAPAWRRGGQPRRPVRSREPRVRAAAAARRAAGRPRPAAQPKRWALRRGTRRPPAGDRGRPRPAGAGRRTPGRRRARPRRGRRGRRAGPRPKPPLRPRLQPRRSPPPRLPHLSRRPRRSKPRLRPRRRRLRSRPRRPVPVQAAAPRPHAAEHAPAAPRSAPAPLAGQTRTYQPSTDRRDDRPTTTTYRPDRGPAPWPLRERQLRPGALRARTPASAARRPWPAAAP